MDTVVVFGCGYAPHSDLRVLWQPLEYLIILGDALGGFIISNPKDVTLATGKHLGRLLKSAPYSKQDYVDLLCLQFSLFKLAKSKGALALEVHIEKIRGKFDLHQLSRLFEEPRRHRIFV